MRKHFLPVIGIGILLLIGVCLNGCCPGPCPFSRTSPDVCDPTEELYIGTQNPYEQGALVVNTIELRRCKQGAPFPMLIHAPQLPGAYAVVLFQHGFLGRNSNYGEVLRHLAGHGFIVVAPQMYEPSLGPLLGIPNANRESEWVFSILDWLPGNLDRVTGLCARTDRLGLAGHSRGGKVIWLLLSSDPDRAIAFAGVDPVDGCGGPLCNQPRSIQGPADWDIPSLIVGTELGGRCAPEGDNHVQFYEASQSPAWHVIALNQGHVDMLDEGSFGTGICPGGPDRAGMRRLTAGLLVAFFRGTLQGDHSAFAYLSDPDLAPIPIAVESK